MLAGLAGIGLFSSLFNAISGADANAKSNQALTNLASQESGLLAEQQQQLQIKQAQPAELATRSIQEQMQQQLQTNNSAFAKPLAISSMGGLRGRLG